MRKKVLITTSSFSQGELLKDFEVISNPYGRRLSEEEIGTLLAEHDPDALLAGVEPLTGSVLKAAESLRIISRCGVGLDSVDLQAAKELGIEVRNTPDAPAPAVAEMALALILSSLRNIPAMDRAMKSGSWEKRKGYLLGAKRVGIIGCGRIGSLVASLIQPFGCQILGYDPFLTEHPVCTMSSLEHILSECDVISLHLPLNEHTKGIIGKDALSLMQPGALLVNTSRGPIVDEVALYEALKAGRVSAALDVYSSEPYSGKLCEEGLSVILSPHQGSSAVETRGEMERQAAEHIIDYFDRQGENGE